MVRRWFHSLPHGTQVLGALLVLVTVVMVGHVWVSPWMNGAGRHSWSQAPMHSTGVHVTPSPGGQKAPAPVEDSSTAPGAGAGAAVITS